MNVVALLMVMALVAPAAKRASPPSPMSVAVSGAVCAWKAKRTRVVGAIRKEQRVAAELTGFVDAEKLYRLQTDVRQIDDEVARLIAAAATEGARILPCTHRMVARLAECRSFWRDGELFSGWIRQGDCAAEDLRPYMDAIRDPL